MVPDQATLSSDDETENLIEQLMEEAKLDEVEEKMHEENSDNDEPLPISQQKYATYPVLYIK